MTTITKRDYMRTVQKRYFKASKKGKSLIINEICANLDIQRKSAIRLVNSDLDLKKRPRLPNNLIYDNKVIWILEKIWKLLDFPCGTILKAAIPLWLEFIKEHFPIDSLTEKLLLQISPSTIDRRLRDKKKKLKAKIYSTSKPGLLLRSQVPIKTCSSDISEPGHLELDTVAHCGSSNSGDYGNTVNSVCIYSTWVERRAIPGKSQRFVHKAIDDIKINLPFAVKSFDFDNEFLTWHLISYCQKHNIACTRSRPYKKDDQAHIEQKNATHVRRIFGRIRLDKPSVIDLMNDLYRNELRLYHNFFKPSQKLIRKKYVGSKVFRKFQKPLTPYQRLLKSKHISREAKDNLTQIFKSLNPIKLKMAIDLKIKRIFQEQRKS